MNVFVPLSVNVPAPALLNPPSTVVLVGSWTKLFDIANEFPFVSMVAPPVWTTVAIFDVDKTSGIAARRRPQRAAVEIDGRRCATGGCHCRHRERAARKVERCLGLDSARSPNHPGIALKR